MVNEEQQPPTYNHGLPLRNNKATRNTHTKFGSRDITARVLFVTMMTTIRPIDEELSRLHSPVETAEDDVEVGCWRYEI